MKLDLEKSVNSIDILRVTYEGHEQVHVCMYVKLLSRGQVFATP